MSTRDKLPLSVRERQQLARMRSSLQAADPRLARLLSGRGRNAYGRGLLAAHGGLHAIFTRAGLSVAARPWTGPALTLVGLAIVVLAVGWALWLAVAGSLVLALGLGANFYNLYPYLTALWSARAGAGATQDGAGGGRDRG